jgi:AraC family transcriptional regulator of arabinose operon
MHITKAKALWPERKGFHLRRQSTGDQYIFLHLLSPVKIRIKDQWISVRRGGCILYNKYDYQEFVSDEDPLLHDYFHLQGELDRLMEQFGLSYTTVYYPQNSDKITQILQDLEQECMTKGSFGSEFCNAKLQELLIILARSTDQFSASHGIDGQTYNRFLRLRQDFHTRFDSDLSVNEMAEMVNLSPSRFYALYKIIFGVSPKKDYLNIRIEHAKNILKQRRYSVAQVAAMSGYNNQYHFIRQFKEVVGVTPGKYLKKQAELPDSKKE